MGNTDRISERRLRKPEVLPSGMTTVFEQVSRESGTPTYVYFEKNLKRNADRFLAIPAPFGLEVSFAMKALPTAAVLRVFDRKGLHIDASTFNEVLRAMDPDKAAIPGHKIRLTSQEVQSRERLLFLANNEVSYTAGSLEQLKTYGEALPGTQVGIRFNPGIGSGGHAKTTTGGEGSPFGIYGQHEAIKGILKEHNLTLTTAHLHIGSGSDPVEQKRAMAEGLKIVRMYPNVTTLDMGGGFHVARMDYEKATDIKEMGETMCSMLKDFAKEPEGRELALVIEPGTALVADGYIVSKIQDKVPGPSGMTIFKVDGGMHVNPRPALYEAQHPLIVIPQDGGERGWVNGLSQGICCESGDTLTPKGSQFLVEGEIGDLMVIGGAGAYTASMANNYNSLEFAEQVLVRESGNIAVISSRQEPRTIWERESVPADL